MIALVGYTGFVGSNIYAAGKDAIDCVYNSKNVQEAYGTAPDLLIYAGMRAEKYLANTAPPGRYRAGFSGRGKHSQDCPQEAGAHLHHRCFSQSQWQGRRRACHYRGAPCLWAQPVPAGAVGPGEVPGCPYRAAARALWSPHEKEFYLRFPPCHPLHAERGYIRRACGAGGPAAGVLPAPGERLL